jgi:hypothetical protein
VISTPPEGGSVESRNGIDLDGDRTGRDEHASARDARAERSDLASRPVALAVESPRDDGVARSASAVGGAAGPRCARCGRRARFVRFECVPRRISRPRLDAALHARVDSTRAPPATSRRARRGESVP